MSSLRLFSFGAPDRDREVVVEGGTCGRKEVVDEKGSWMGRGCGGKGVVEGMGLCGDGLDGSWLSGFISFRF